MKGLAFSQGDLGDNIPWEIHFNYEVYSSEPRCGHCYKNRNDDWVCPRVVMAFNQGGEDSTRLCLDCILEIAQDGLPIPTPVFPCRS